MFVFFHFVFVLALGQVLLETPPDPPLDVRVANGQLTWTPASTDSDVVYTVQNRSFDSGVWINVSGCVQTPSTSCNVSTKAEKGCVALAVLAEKRGMRSRPVEACSLHAEPCTPRVSVSAVPGTLAVFVNRNNSLTLEHGAHVMHRVFFGKEGETLRMLKDTEASVSVGDLEEGQRYCIRAQYLYFSTPVGMSSCSECHLIPQSSSTVQTSIVVSVAVLVLVLLVSLTAYMLIHRLDRIKEWLRPPCQIPKPFSPESFTERVDLMTSSSIEERWDRISSIESEETTSVTCSSRELIDTSDSSDVEPYS